MDRLDDCIRRRRIDVMRPRYRLRAPIALEFGPDASKARQRSIIIDREPDDILLLSLRVRLWRTQRSY